MWIYAFSCLFLLAHATKQINTLPHKAIRSIPESYQHDPVLSLYHPLLLINQGCAPFPAVDTYGSISGGLKRGGLDNGQCSISAGQVYGRSGLHGHGPNKRLGLMYAWFYPKEQRGYDGHRYGWQALVVWLYGENDHRAYAVSYTTAPGRWEHDFQWERSWGTVRPIVAKSYESISTFVTGMWGAVRQGAASQPLVAWKDLSEAARVSLDGFDFGSAGSQRCVINDANFEPALADAFVEPRAMS